MNRGSRLTLREVTGDSGGGDGVCTQKNKGEPGLYILWYQKIGVGFRNDRILKVIALKFKAEVSFGVGRSGRGSNFGKKVPHSERLQL